ncbi:MAG: hypothetical protein Q7S11_01035 [bacterium]|nr:hypothetical protein [bacterium]
MFTTGVIICTPFLVFGYFKRKLRSSRLQALAREFGLSYKKGISPLQYGFKYPFLNPAFFECNIIEGAILTKKIRIYDHYRGDRPNYAFSRGLMNFIDLGGPWNRGTRIYIDECPYRIKPNHFLFASIKDIYNVLNNLKNNKLPDTFLKAL